MTKKKKEFKNLFDTISDIEKKNNSLSQEMKKENSQIAEILIQGKKMHDEIAIGLEHAFRCNDIAPSQFRAYCSQPQNFSAEEWKEVESQKRANDELVLELHKRIHISSKIMPFSSDEKSTSHDSCEKKRRDENKERKKPLLTKRNWMNMH